MSSAHCLPSSLGLLKALAEGSGGNDDGSYTRAKDACSAVSSL